jgi:membrane protease YdiL (CAAX protease family)
MSTDAAEQQPPPKRGRPLIAWLVISTLTTVAVGFQFYASRFGDPQERGYYTELELEGRYLVGLREIVSGPPETIYQQAQALNRGPYGQRLRFVVLAGELKGPDEALVQLSAIRDLWEERPPSDEEVRLTDLLDKLYGDYAARRWWASWLPEDMRDQLVCDAPSLDEDDRATLREELGWFGELALAPRHGLDPAARAAQLEQARRTAAVLLTTVLVALALAFLGFLLLCAGVLALVLRLTRFHFARGSRDGGVYAETFALWMILYMLPMAATKFIPWANSRMLIMGLFGLASLSALAWPVLRGVPWRRVRQDLGWWTPGAAGVEVLWGVGCYLSSLPLLGIALLVSNGMLSLYKHVAGEDPFGVPVRATHPAGDVLLHADWWLRVQIFLAAAVFAPIIEETMFRGVLYRHLREVGVRWPRAVSVLFSALAVSFLFAVVHPQGILGVPMLMALALGFTAARELRGSLVGSMAAHGLNNGLVTVLLLSM